MKVSCVVLTHNEEKNIAACLDSLAWCEEIIVMDDFSDDATTSKAQEKGAVVYQRKVDHDFAKQRNKALEIAKSPWILYVDADERVPEQLAEEIKNLGTEVIYSGFRLKRRDYFLHQWLDHGETGNIKLVRLARKDRGLWVRPIHEVWQIKGKVGSLTHELLHYPHQTLREFVAKVGDYSTVNAELLYRERQRVSGLDVLIYPLAKFLKNFFFLQGFRDGLPGFIHAVVMSFHSFLSRAKLWLIYHGSK